MILRIFRFLFPIIFLLGVGFLAYRMWQTYSERSVINNKLTQEETASSTETVELLKNTVQPENPVPKVKVTSDKKSNNTGKPSIPKVVEGKNIQKSTVSINNKTFTVEVASTEKTRTNGLMYRKTLPKDHGMLFVFDRSAVYDFWMPNVSFSLDIVWISEDLKIVDIKTVPPCEEKIIQNCPAYRPDGRAKYVLEVKANTFPGVIGEALIINR